MKLPKEFCRLPLRFDAARLAQEVDALAPDAWREHPLNYPGNRAVRLISGGGGENDDMGGAMAETRHLASCPYIRQVLASFGVVWSRSRLMMLGPGNQVPQHCDINYHWFYRVRVHIPVVTFPQVLFHCDRQTVHMGAGEAWIFDNWRPHRVINPTPHHRVHLVADTIGNAAFWELARRGQWDRFDEPSDRAIPVLPYDSAGSGTLLTESVNIPRVMPPSEVTLLVADLVQDLAQDPRAAAAGAEALLRFRAVIEALTRDWRHLWSLYGDSENGWPHYAALRDHVRRQLEPAAGVVGLRSNQLSAYQVLDARVLKHLVNPPGSEAFRKRHVA